jgi:hypothetical protein
VRFLLLLAVFLSSGLCHAQTNIVAKLENNWTECLWSSFSDQKAQSPDKNLAAERTFAACKEELLSIEGTSMFLPPEGRGEADAREWREAYDRPAAVLFRRGQLHRRSTGKVYG